jgi:hypothetical protein
MSSTAKNILYSMTLLLLFPMSAFADIKIIIGSPAYQHRHNYSNSYSNNHHYKQNKYSKYDFPPYSYRNNKKYYSPSYRYQPDNYSYNYNPYTSFRYKQNYQDAYRQGFRDGLHKRKQTFKLGR